MTTVATGSIDLGRGTGEAPDQPPKPWVSAPEALYIVSHRLPMTFEPEKGWARSPGGLVSALSPALDGLESPVVWFGHCEHADDIDGLGRNGSDLAPIALSKTDRSEAIEGFSNRALWPALHGLDGNIEQNPSWWSGYERRSKQVARVVAERATTDASVWIHDYQNFGIASPLAALRPDLALGLFCHTPVDAEGLGSLHQADRLAEHIAAHRFIGTQTTRDADALRRFLDECGARHMPAIAAIPVGIDVARWDRYRHDPDVAERAAQHACRSGALAIGVDRIDYTKGLPHKLLAVEMLLDAGVIQPDEFRLVQVAVPSRTEIPVYRFLGDQLRDIATRINSRHRRSDQIPVVDLITEQLPPRQIAALMRAADIGIVTPCRDGMNLVSLEFASINADRPAALVLGSRAGSVDHIGEWCDVVDGSDVIEVAATIRAVLQRSQPDRLERSRTRAAAARQLTSSRWIQEFMDRLTAPAGSK